MIIIIITSYLEKLNDILAVAFYNTEPRAQRLL